MRVVATGTSSSVTASWMAAAVPGASSATAYTAVLTSSVPRSVKVVKVVAASVHTVTFGTLTAGATYTLSVTAKGPYGVSRAVSTRAVTAPAITTATGVATTTTAPQRLYALDSTGALVTAAAAGGATTTLQTGAVDYAVDRAGDAFVLTADSVVEISASGVRSTLLTGVSGGSDIQVDAQGDVFVQEGTSIVKVAAGSTTATTVATAPARIIGWNVDTTGVVRVMEYQYLATTAALVTYPTTGAATTLTLTIPTALLPNSAVFDARGDAYFTENYSGASGAKLVSRVAAGTTTVSTIGTGDFVWGVGLTDSAYVVQGAAWCNSPSIISGSCVPDYTAASIAVTSDAGVTSSVPVSGLSVAASYSAATGAQAVTSDSAGCIYLTSNSGVVVYPAAGGAPKTLLTGAFSDVSLNY